MGLMKGISDQIRYPLIGKFKVGKFENGHPTSLDYFRYEGPFNDKVEALLGLQPREMHIIFAEEIDKSVIHEYRRYTKSGLVCHGNNREAVQFKKNKGEEDLYIPCPCDLIESRDGKSPQCSEYLRITFMLPDFDIMGMFSFSTGSYNTRIGILSQLQILMGNCGRISGIPLVMTVEMSANSTDPKMKYPIVKIFPETTLRNLLSINTNLTTKQVFMQLSNLAPETTLPQLEHLPEIPQPEEVNTDLEVTQRQEGHSILDMIAVVLKWNEETISAKHEHWDELIDTGTQFDIKDKLEALRALQNRCFPQDKEVSVTPIEAPILIEIKSLYEQLSQLGYFEKKTTTIESEMKRACNIYDKGDTFSLDILKMDLETDLQYRKDNYEQSLNL